LQAANAVGYGGESHQAILDATHTPKGSVDFFVELHIEQGPLLEKVSWGKLHQETASSGGVGAHGFCCCRMIHHMGSNGHL
jgi:hypothetical protein